LRADALNARHDAQRGVQLVDGAVRVDANVVFQDARAANEIGLALVAASCRRGWSG
jgi:hypothetical protein